MHIDPAQIPADLKEPAADAGWPPDQGDLYDGEDDGSMEEMIAYLVTDMGYSRNECPGHCPHKAEEHAHLHSPGNPASIGIPPADFIYWGDGTSTRSDPTRSESVSLGRDAVSYSFPGDGEPPQSASAEIVTGVVTEYGTRYKSGEHQVWNTAPIFGKAYPLAEMIAERVSNGGKVYRRRLIVVDDWAEVDAP